MFALALVDVTGDGNDEVVACAWDGMTYFVDSKDQNLVKFKFGQAVSAFTAGLYSLEPGILHSIMNILRKACPFPYLYIPYQ